MMEREDVLFEKEDVEEDEWFLFTKKFLDDNEIYDEELFDWFMEHDLYSDSEVYFYLEDSLEI